MLVKRALTVFAFVFAAFVAAGAVGVGPLNPVFYRPISISANGGVAAVDIQPIPEGPQPKGRPPIALIQLVITLGNGVQVTYGPCYRPASIDHLWAEIVYIDTNGQCAPRCGPGGRAGP